MEGLYNAGAYLSCFLVAWKSPSALKRGGAHQKGGGDVLTAPTNNQCISSVLCSSDSEALIVLVRTQSNQEPVEMRAIGLASQLVIPLSQATTIAAIHM